MGHYHLNVGLCSEGSTVDHRTTEGRALVIDVLSCIYVINCVDNKGLVVPEGLVENVFVFWTHSRLKV